MTRIGKSLSAKDTHEGQMVAHQIKGVAASLNADQMQSIATELEAQIKKANWDSVGKLVDQLGLAVDQTKVEFKKMVASQNSQ